jgi:hypothetical protein
MPVSLLSELAAPIGSGGAIILLIWVLVKLTRVETKVERLAALDEKVTNHGERLAVVEPMAKRAHERLDKRGFSS